MNESAVVMHFDDVSGPSVLDDDDWNTPEFRQVVAEKL